MGQYAFLFTDIEGSTSLWERFSLDMQVALARHDDILRAAAALYGGHVFHTIGDAFCIAFATSQQAILAAVTVQEQLSQTDWGRIQTLRARMGIYFGEASERDNDYFGACVNRVARLRDAAHGGQTITADVDPEAFADLLPKVSFESKGYHKFKGISEALHVYQINIDGLPRDFLPIRSLSTHPNNLPASVTSFVGRQTEIRELSDLFARPDVRLITLSGFGGAGKTRLALEFGRSTLERYPQGVWFVDLASLTDPALVLPAIAHACRIEEDPRSTALDQVRQHFHEAQALLLLDNFEQVEDAAEEIASLLSFCPQLRILVTSRELLNLSAEHEYELPPLSLQESRNLFEARARKAYPSFAVTGENHSILETLCGQFEGMPLVMELAAVQVRSQTLNAISMSLRERMEALATRMRDMPARHRSLRAAIDWSYDLLTDSERRLFRALGVFMGGFTTHAVDAVCGVECHHGPNTRTLLMELREKSLLRAPDANDRFGMLESLRQYGQDRLVELGEESEARARHLDWFLQLAERSETRYRTSEQTRWLDLLEDDLDNLRAALDWSIANENKIAQGLRLSGALGYFWEVRGHFREAQDRLEIILKLSIGERSGERARALNIAGHLAWYQGNFGVARQYQEESLRICEEIQDRPGSAQALANLGDIAYARGDYPQALALQNRALILRRESGDQAGVAFSLTNLGNIHYNQGKYIEAQGYYEACSVIAQELGDQRLLAFTLNNLGMLAFTQAHYAEASRFHEQGLALFRGLKEKQGIGLMLVNLAADVMARGEFVRTRQLYMESLEILIEVGDTRVLAFALEGLSTLASEQGNLPAEVKLCAAANYLRKRLGAPLPPIDQADFDSRLKKAKAQLGAERYNNEWELGAKCSIEQVITYASEL